MKLTPVSTHTRRRRDSGPKTDKLLSESEEEVEMERWRGDHMFVSFKNLSDQHVMIKENTKVVQLQPRNQGSREADDTTRDIPLGIHGVSKTGILVLH